MGNNQEIANGLSYKERYRNYVRWFRNREKERLKLKPWQYSSIKPYGYGMWLKHSADMSIPADCRAGQGKEKWQA
jgi:hypothetical protein